MFRIDPLTKEGVFDSDFFGSDEYPAISKKVEWYLHQEGFDSKDTEFVITLLDHLWVVKCKPFSHS